MKKITKSQIFTFCLWLLLLILLIFSFANFRNFSKVYSGVSLRYTTPVTWEDAQKLEEAIQKNEDENKIGWPTFWTQKEATLKTDDKSVDLTGTFYSGNGSLLWEDTFITGAFPTQLEGQSCAISSQLAWDIWASNDVLGKTISIEDVDYTITGIFKDTTPRIFVSVADAYFKDGWINLNLEGLSAKNSRAEAEEFVQQYGLAAPSIIVDENETVTVAKLILLLPLIVTVIYCLFRLYHTHKNDKRWKKDLFLFGALLVLALALPWLLSMLPPWLVPNQWSDFSFWGDIGKQVSTHLKEWFSLNPTPKDVLAKMFLLKQAVFLFCFTLLLPILVRRSLPTDK